ncbi:hypothetical protein [Pseudonocardia sp. H11422]|uniref:hypothetical protein n=1 Tax=Pseudonocardia sp. H11422 TaxID=2835866 RepID=UPI001BDC7B56|nr:hypothetical protein [Pseudonocardia sp. H11422]
MTVSTRALIVLADALRQRRSQISTRWRRLGPGGQALLVVAYEHGVQLGRGRDHHNQHVGLARGFRAAGCGAYPTLMTLVAP